MSLEVDIDRHSGFCGGVIRAIGHAEQWLDSRRDGTRLYSLGAIVHNEEELSRLEKKGLVTLDLKDLYTRGRNTGETLLIRAHGEPPETYALASELGFTVIDCTCPVVLRLQKSIKEAYARLNEGNTRGQLIIFGKIGHAEVLGLVGQVGGDALVVENMAMVEAALAEGKVLTEGPVEIFSQTTKSPSEYALVCNMLAHAMSDENLLTIHHTICSQVASRHSELAEFACAHDVIVFVCGSSSSNGKVLCDLCRSVNGRTFRIGSPSEIRSEWFCDSDRVGVCGATSTPKWLLEEVATHILTFC